MALIAVPNLTREDARTRADLLSVEHYDISLDLTDGQGNASERTFRSITTVTFAAARPGASTFIDVIADRFHSVTLNGAAVDTSGYTTDGGLVLPDLAAENTLVVDADLLYTNSGEGMHRSVDPSDGETYVYTQFETADAKRVFACFDQPDLKATFTIRATVPATWEASSTGRQTGVTEHEHGKTIEFAESARMSTYVTALVAGPYHVVREHHDGIDLGIFCRKSMAQHLDLDELWAVTKQGFDWFHENFGLRYPFDKYDQLFVPEYNAGAMENAGCVTINELYVFRSKTTDRLYERRGLTILHEQAHMWFGDLVTMKWWDDLWLNESFAEWAAVSAQAENTRWTNAWTTFANFEKEWAYREDMAPGTHPIASDAPDVQTAEVNFDGIAYAKGSCVLKQLTAYIGHDTFLAGVRKYFQDHAYGNTTLADLLGAMEAASGRDLGSWSKLWLETTGVNTFTPEFTLAEDGTYATFALRQSAPSDVATTNVLRPHRLAVGLYEEQDGRLVRVHRVELDAEAELTEVPELVGRRQPDFLLVNDDDLTYCKTRLDERSIDALRNGGIGRFEESLPRALAWITLWDMTREGELATRDYLDLVIAGAEAETDIGVLQYQIRQAVSALNVYADPAWAPTGWSRFADKAYQALHDAGPGSDQQLAWTQALMSAARSDAHVSFLEGLLDGTTTVEGLSIDPDLRWSLVQALAARGRLGADEIDAEEADDQSTSGREKAATARALIPTPEAKERAWQEAMHNDELSNAMSSAVMLGFSHPTQGALVAPFMPRYFAEIRGVWDRRTSELAQTAVSLMFPRWTSTITEDTLAAADEFLAADGLPPALRRLVSEARAGVARAMRNRGVDAAAN